jgi:hypothetical protein
MFFERKNALKRNVATRQPARDVSRFLTFYFVLKVKIPPQLEICSYATCKSTCSHAMIASSAAQ